MSDIPKKVDKKVRKVIENMARFLLSQEVKKNPRIIIEEAEKCNEEAKTLSSRQRYEYISFFNDIIADDKLFCNQQYAIFNKKYNNTIAEGRQKNEAKVIDDKILALLLEQAVEYRERAYEFYIKKIIIEGLASFFEKWFVEGNAKPVEKIANDVIILSSIKNNENFQREALEEILKKSKNELASLKRKSGYDVSENDEKSDSSKDDDYEEDFH